MTATSNGEALWWISIGIGVVVILCVVVLLSLLAAFVRDIDYHVAVVNIQLDHVIANTTTATDLHEAARLIGGLGAELEEQVNAVSSGTGRL